MSNSGQALPIVLLRRLPQPSQPSPPSSSSWALLSTQGGHGGPCPQSSTSLHWPIRRRRHCKVSSPASARGHDGSCPRSSESWRFSSPLRDAAAPERALADVPSAASGVRRRRRKGNEECHGRRRRGGWGCRSGATVVTLLGQLLWGLRLTPTVGPRRGFPERVNPRAAASTPPRTRELVKEGSHGAQQQGRIARSRSNR